MSRYIDADALIAKMPTVMDMQDTYLPIHFKEWLIDTAPSIDIVRCAECKYWHELIDAKGQGRCDADEHNPFRVSVGISTADFYCSYGEREGE